MTSRQRGRAGGLLPKSSGDISFTPSDEVLEMSLDNSAQLPQQGNGEPSLPLHVDQHHTSDFPPPHWQAPTLRILRGPFTVLCWIGVGQDHLGDLWQDLQVTERYTRAKEQMIERLTTIVVVAGLLLGATAAFITTVPPVTDVVNYTRRGPYILLLLSFGITLGGLIVGSTIIYALYGYHTKPHWLQDIVTSSRLRVCCLLIILGYPFFAVAVSTMLLACGVLVAAWASQDKLVKGGCIFVVLVPASMILIFMLMLRQHTHSFLRGLY